MNTIQYEQVSKHLQQSTQDCREQVRMIVIQYEQVSKHLQQSTHD